jgi:hypothetical protein
MTMLNTAMTKSISLLHIDRMLSNNGLANTEGEKTA